MKNNLNKNILFAATILASIFIGSSLKSLEHPNAFAAVNFSGVSTFNTPTGRLGFFEQSTGKIYLYDNNLSTCVFVGQLTELGQPIVKVQ